MAATRRIKVAIVATDTAGRLVSFAHCGALITTQEYFQHETDGKAPARSPRLRPSPDSSLHAHSPARSLRGCRPYEHGQKKIPAIGVLRRGGICFGTRTGSMLHYHRPEVFFGIRSLLCAVIRHPLGIQRRREPGPARDTAQSNRCRKCAADGSRLHRVHWRPDAAHARWQGSAAAHG